MGSHMGLPPRKKHFIDSNVQGALARRIIFHWLVFMLVAAAVAFVVQVLADPFRGLKSHLQDLWWSQGPFLLVMVFLMPVFVMDAVKLSHRFAGPIFSLRRAIRRVAAGEAPRKLKFRERDFWRDLAEDYNAMLSKLGALEDESSEKTDDVKLVESK
jgi:methyl-accepting chemotaxis protein